MSRFTALGHTVELAKGIGQTQEMVVGLDWHSEVRSLREPRTALQKEKGPDAPNLRPKCKADV